MAGSFIPSRTCAADPQMSTQRTTGPLGLRDAADPSHAMCLVGDTPGALGSNDYAAPRSLQRPTQTCSIVPYDLAHLDRLFRSVGLAKAMAQNTRIEWQDYNDSALLNFVYGIMPWKGKPGHVEVMTGDQKKIEREADEEALRVATVFFSKKCPEGPASAAAYLKSLEEIRESYFSILQGMYRDARQINDEIIRNTEEVVLRLRQVKAGATLFLAPASLATGPLGAGLYLGYEITIAVVDNWDKGAQATILGVGKEVVEEGAEKGGEKLGHAIAKGEQAAGRIRQLEELVAKYSQQLVGKGPGKTAKLNTRIRLRTQEIQSLQKVAGRQRFALLGKLASRLNFLFVAKDMWDSMSELAEIDAELKKLEQKKSK